MEIDLAQCRLRVSIVSYSESMDCLVATISSLLVSIKTAASDGLIETPCTIILVDNRESGRLDIDALLYHLDDYDSNLYEIELTHGHGNIGYGSGHNLAIDAENGGYHLFLNPDVELEPSGIGVGIEYLQENLEVSMVSPSATNQNKVKQHLCKRFPTVLDLFIRGLLPVSVRGFFTTRLAAYEMHELSDLEPVQDITIASGCCMLCRNKTLLEIAGFDPSFFLYFEDFDLSLRLSKISKLAYLPKMRIVHKGGNASRKGLLHIIYFTRSAFSFYSKHGWRWVKR